MRRDSITTRQRDGSGKFLPGGRGKKDRGKSSVLSEIPLEICRGRNRSSKVSSGKFHPPGASEESARKVPKAITYIVCSVVVDVGVRYCHCTLAFDEHPASLPNKEGACVWSVQIRFFRWGRRKKVREKGSVRFLW